MIYKSSAPNSIDNFSLVYSQKYTIDRLDYDCDTPYVQDYHLCGWTYRGYAYPQAWWSNGKFIMMNTIYLPLTYNDTNADPSYMRATYVSTVTPTASGVTVTKPTKLVAVKGDYTKGHYSISKERNGTVGLAFNIHLDDKSINPVTNTQSAPHDNRTNLYFMYSKDGDNWYNIDGTQVVNGILSSGTSNRGITSPSQLGSIAVREYHNPVNNTTNESWCGAEYGDNGYVCRRVYLKDIDFTTDAAGKPNRVEILYVANRSIEPDAGVEFGAFPSPLIHSSDIYLARYFHLNDGSGWQGERIRDAAGKDVVDHNYSTGTLKIKNGQSYIITPASNEADGFAGQDQVKVFRNTTGAKGNWSELHSKYAPALPNGETANYVRSIHNATSDIQVMWSQGPEQEGFGSVLFGDLSYKKLVLPNSSNIPAAGLVLPVQ